MMFLAKGADMSQNIGNFLTYRARRDSALKQYMNLLATRLSYRELNDRSNQVAHALVDLGVSHGDRVGLLLMNGKEFIESFLQLRRSEGSTFH